MYVGRIHKCYGLVTKVLIVQKSLGTANLKYDFISFAKSFLLGIIPHEQWYTILQILSNFGICPE